MQISVRADDLAQSVVALQSLVDFRTKGPGDGGNHPGAWPLDWSDMAQLTLPPNSRTVERFWSKVNKDGPVMKAHLGPCWEWTRALQTAGYGNVWIDGTCRTAHKVAWVWANGPVPDGLQLDHLCEFRRCCRPDHLDPVTSRENSHRTKLSVNSINASKTTCKNGHPYDGVASNGRRYCQSCRNEYHREYNRKRRRAA